MIRSGLERWLNRVWYGGSRWFVALLPLSWLYCLSVMLRRALYRIGLLSGVRLPVRLLVVGNLNAGGSGKTPLVIALAGLLERNGIRTGIVTRGYRGRAKHWPQRVTKDSDPLLVGDEAVELAAATGLPVFAGPDRVRAVQSLLAEAPVDAVVSDDGLQHYRLQRDLEICVVDAGRGSGNGHCLPAGPLREPGSRLDEVDVLVTLGGEGPGAMRMEPAAAHPVSGKGAAAGLSQFRDQRVHAVAGIGNPRRFFDDLERAGIDCIEHVFPDHHVYRPSDLAFGDDAPVLMTRKDAVKCAAFAEPHWWFITVETGLAPELEKRILRLFPATDNRKATLGQETA